MRELLKQLTDIPERQLEGETKALEIIIRMLSKEKISYSLERFINYVPKTEYSLLLVGGKRLPHASTSFTGGELESKDVIISSLLSTDDFNEPNINFNPYSDAICKSSFFNVPAFAISRKHLPIILAARKIKGESCVKKVKHECYNVLIPFANTPSFLLFTHYDSIGSGAIDNASGVATCLYLLKHHKKLLSKSWLIISGCEELSYEWPIYWGKGYKEFLKRHKQEAINAKKIIIVDSVGHTPPIISKDPEIIWEAFPLTGEYKALENKTVVIHGELNKLMKYYHSHIDKPNLIKTKYIKETAKAVLKYCK